jgi:citryl-CoA lyase
MNTSVAAGITALGDKHGGAIEEAMKLLQSEKSAENIVEEKLEKGEKIPGLGHKVYEDQDPRAQKIVEKADELGLKGEFTEKMMEVQEVLSEEKVDLVLNVDGAIAGVMSDLGFEPELGKGFFIIARTPGLVAHVREEMDEEDFRREKGEYERE